MAERWICLGGAGLPDSAATIGTFVIARAGRDAAKVRGHDGEHQREHDDEPRQCPDADQVVRALFEARAVRKPHDETQKDADNRSDEADDDAVGPHHEAHVTVGRPERFEHPDRAKPALCEHGEAADGHEGDEQHLQSPTRPGRWSRD